MKKINFKRGITHKTATLMTALTIIVAGISYTTLSGNNPVNNAKIASLMNNKDSITQSVQAYVYKVNAKSVKYYSQEEIIKGVSDENIVIDGIVDDSATFEVDGKKVYKLDDNKCRKNLDLELSKINVSGADWYIDSDATPYLVFKDYDSISSYIKKDLDDNVNLSNLVIYDKE